MSAEVTIDYDPRVPIEQRRALSPILASFPWRWEGIINKPRSLLDLADALPEFRNFAACLHRYESVLLGFSGRQTSEDLLRTLGVEFKISGDGGLCKRTVNIFQPEKLKVPQYIDLCSVVFSYKFLETLALHRKVVNPLSPSSSRPQLQLPSLDKGVQKDELQGFERLKNWIELLYEFKAIVEKNDKKYSTSQIPLPQNPFQSLMQMLSVNRDNGAYNAIESNFLQAAIHTSAMRSIIFPDSIVPDLPGNVECVAPLPSTAARDEVNPASDLNSESDSTLYLYQAYRESSSSSKHSSSARAPLYLATFISPLFLILHFVITKKSFSRRLLLDQSAKLGPYKPPLLMKIEDLFFSAILALSKGRTQPYLILKDLVESIPWSEVEMATELERKWFSVEDRPLIPSPDPAFLQLPTPINEESPRNQISDNFAPPSNAAASTSAKPSAQIHAQQEYEASDQSRELSSATLLPPLRPQESHEGDSPAEGGPLSHQDPDLNTRNGDGDQAGPQEGPLVFSSSDVGDPSSFQSSNPLSDIQHGFPDVEATTAGFEDDVIVSEQEGSSAGKEASNVPDEQRMNIDPDSTLSELSSSSEDDSMGSGESLRGKQSLGAYSPHTERDLKTPRSSGNPSHNTRPGKSAAKRTRPGRANKAKRPAPATAEGASDQPIDIEQISSLFDPAGAHDCFESISLSTKPPPTRVSCDVDMIAYDADGGKWEFRPQFHYEIHVTRFKQFYERMQAGYHLGLPTFRSAPDLSCIKIVSWAIFNQLSTCQLSELMKKHVLVTGCPFEKGVKFDAKGLRTLAPLSAQRSITDFSVLMPVANEANDVPCTPSVVSGLVQDILDNTLNRNKILNGLDFPLWRSRGSNAYSVDLAAWDYVQGLQSTEERISFPVHHMSWGTAGGQHTFTFLHIDSDGLGTEDGPECGSKLWGVVSPRQSLPLSSIHFFLHQGFRVNEVVESSDYDFEAVVLRPGDRFYMKPGTPHFVYGLEDAICLGSHHYVTTLMQETLQGLIHAFVLNKFLTNTQHPPALLLLRQILIFFQAGTMLGQIPTDDPSFQHLPDLQTMDGVLNVVSVAILSLLSNVLDFRTYTAPNQHETSKPSKEQFFLLKEHDVNSIPLRERQGICYVRGIALQLLRWINEECIFKDGTGATVPDLPLAFTVQILRALLSYKKLAQKEGLVGAPHCTYQLLSAQIANVVECDLDLQRLWSMQHKKPATSLAWELKETYTVDWRAGWQRKWKAKDSSDYLFDGLTPNDYKYFTIQRQRCDEDILNVMARMNDERGPAKRRKF